MRILIPDVTHPQEHNFTVQIDFGGNEAMAELFRRYWLTLGTADFYAWLKKYYPDDAWNVVLRPEG